MAAVVTWNNSSVDLLPKYSVQDEDDFFVQELNNSQLQQQHAGSPVDPVETLKADDDSHEIDSINDIMTQSKTALTINNNQD